MAVKDENLAALVKGARLASKLTQPEAVARTGNVGITTWSLTERGTPPTAEKLAAMAVTVKIKPSDLRGLGYEEAADVAEQLQRGQSQRMDKMEAIMRAQEILLNAGWEVTLRTSNEGYDLRLD